MYCYCKTVIHYFSHGRQVRFSKLFFFSEPLSESCIILHDQIMGLYSLGHMGGWALEWDCLDRPEGCTDTPTNGRSIN
jgi:hypothetical protein